MAEVTSLVAEMPTAVETEVSVAEVRELKRRKRVKMEGCKDK